MDNKKWTAVTGVLLLAGIASSTIFFQQRNDAQQHLRESRDQITVLDQRNIELNKSLENQKSRLSAEVNLAEDKQAALASAENRMAELKTRLNEQQAELDNVQTLLQQANGETSRLEGNLASAEVRIADLASERNRLEEEQKTLVSRIDVMDGKSAEKATTIEMLTHQAEEQNQRITSLHKEIQILRDAMAIKEKQLIESQDSLGARQAEADALRKDLATEKESAAELETRLKELTTECNGLIAQTTALKTEGSDLRERIADLQTRHREALTGRDEKIATLSSTLKSSSKRLDDLEKDNGILDSKLKEANLTINGLRDQIQEVITRVPALKNRLEQSMEKYQAVREDLTEARDRQVKLEAQQKAMRETYDALLTGLKQQLDTKEASIEEYREKLKVTFVDRILFGFSQVHISPEGKAALDQLAGVLANVPEGKISITGHADSIPVASKFWYRFPSNWELSSARAAAVARYLLKRADLEPSRIEVIGLSSHQPVADNDTEENRAKNRRVEIIITPGRYPDRESK